jgi:hypothetical protein
MSTTRVTPRTEANPALDPGLNPALRVTRIVLIALGIAGLAWGAYVLVDSVKPARIPGVALWAGAAILLHDGVIAPLVFFSGILLRRGGQRVSGTIIVVVQCAVVVGSIVSLIVVPLLVAQSRGNDNPTVLPLDYGANVALFWAAVVVVAAGVSFGLSARGRGARA